jgi:hypothetical protein
VEKKEPNIDDQPISQPQAKKPETIHKAKEAASAISGVGATLAQKEKAKAENRTGSKVGDNKIQDAADIRRKKLICTAIIAFLLITVQIRPIRGIVYENWIFTTFDRKAEECIDDSFKRALIAFGVARGINSVISIIQDSELSLEPGGVGVSISLGEAVDPINDLVERFSWVMMASLMALSIQKLLIQIGPWLSLKFMLSFTLLLFLSALWLKGSFRPTLMVIAKKALIATFILRFSVPLSTYVNTLTYVAILDEHYELASEELDVTGSAIENSGFGDAMENVSSLDQDSGLWNRAKSLYNGAASSLNIKDKIGRLMEKTGNLAENFIRLSVIFILNTVLLPIAYLWALLKFTQLLLGRNYGLRFEQNFKSKVFDGKPAEGLAA